MELGPFEAGEAEQIEQILMKHEISFEIEIDDVLKQSQIDNFHGIVRNNPTGAVGSLDLRYIFFMISNEDSYKVAQDLKPFGIEC
jgi:hypothetical protein